MNTRFLATFFAASALLAGLGGCATSRVIESEVQAFATAAPSAASIAPGSAFRFERLPSQTTTVASVALNTPVGSALAAPGVVVPTPAQTQVEYLAQAALEKLGLKRDDAQARYSVQASAQTIGYWADPWGNPWPGLSGLGLGGPGWWPGGLWGSVGLGGRHGGVSIGFPMFGRRWGDEPRAFYQHEVGLIVRDLHTQQVVYETRAAGNGPWGDSTVILATMFDAALKDFPNPPPGPRRIRTELPH